MHFEFDLRWFAVWLILPMVTYLFCRYLIARADRLGMLDLPSNRSSHSVPTPRLGGVGFVPVFGVYAMWVLSQLPINPSTGAITASILMAMMALFLVGAWDDYRDAPAKIRLLFQIVCVVFSLWALSPMFAVFPILWASLFAVVLMLAAVWWVNLFNFMDGADGFAGGQALLIVGAGAAAVGLAGPNMQEYGAVHADFLNVYVALSVGLFLILIGFLVLNWSPARVFMGDSGSTALAFYLFFSSLLVCLIDWRFVGFFLCLVAYFVSDATVTLIARIARRANVFKPHREHAYQVLLNRLEGRHARLALCLLGWNGLVLLPLGVWSLCQAMQIELLATSADWIPAHLSVILPALLPVFVAYGISIAAVCWIRARWSTTGLAGPSY